MPYVLLLNYIAWTSSYVGFVAIAAVVYTVLRQAGPCCSIAGFRFNLRADRFMQLEKRFQ